MKKPHMTPSHPLFCQENLALKGCVSSGILIKNTFLEQWYPLLTQLWKQTNKKYLCDPAIFPVAFLKKKDRNRGTA